eukprot:SAG31_NODE_821_length_11784_cov_62.658194_1_plen_38_part_00
MDTIAIVLSMLVGTAGYVIQVALAEASGCVVVFFAAL